jgi:nicotinate-nucleotide--dimethylbenzimidazole phosphoribosyltransferase
MNLSSQAMIEHMTKNITPVNDAWRLRAREHIDSLTKPLGSLGQLEELAAQIAAIREGDISDLNAKGVYIFAADHGVTEEGVSAYPRDVTRQMVLNFLAGGAAISVLARLHKVALNIVDVGVDADFNNAPGLLHCKVSRGTKNMLHEAAMNDSQLAEALAVGQQMALRAVTSNQGIVAIGEMGIGNTTSASVITCALTGAEAEHATGVGTGVGPKEYMHKIQIVQRILRQHRAGFSSPREMLRCVGGLEIAAMTGMILAASQAKRVIVLDGFISTAAAALAVTLEPNVRDYLIAGHCSTEGGHKILLDHLKLSPVLTLQMRLGEGSGAVLAIPILESAIHLYAEMATFTSANVSQASR